MEIKNLFPGSWGSNCYIISDSGHAAIVDPSASAKGIIDHLAQKTLTLDFIILTHGHFDHIVSLDTLRDATSAPAYIHKSDAVLLSDGEKNAFKLFFGQDRVWRSAEKTLEDGDVLSLGNAQLEIISTPGHTAGSICIKTPDFMLTGDTLFSDSYGRCDLYSGNYSEMRASLKKLRAYDKNTVIYPGHGNPAPLGYALDNAEYL